MNLVDLKTAAAGAGVSVRTIQNWISNYKLPTVKGERPLNSYRYGRPPTLVDLDVILAIRRGEVSNVAESSQ